MGAPLNVRTIRSAGFGIALLLISGSASAQFCAGFIDVAAGHAFCPNLEWVKNRGITSGCQIANSFCPNDPVTRLQMTRFLDRLGRKLTPEIEFVDEIPGGVNIQASPNNYMCQSAPHPITDHPRTAVVHALWWGNVDAPVTWSADLWYSTDGGMSWAYMSNWIPAIFATAAGYTQATTFARADLAVGSTYIFAIRIREYPVATGGTGNFTDGVCHVMIEIRNQNGSSSPFDTAAATGHNPASNAANR